MGTVKASSVSLSGSDAAAKKATCCTEDVSGKCSGNTASATDLAEQANDGYQFACGAGFTVKASSVSLSGSDAAAKKAACCDANQACGAATCPAGYTAKSSASATACAGSTCDFSSGSDKGTCCDAVSGKCSGNAATATDLAEASGTTFQFACGAGFTVKGSSVALSGSDAAAK